MNDFEIEKATLKKSFAQFAKQFLSCSEIEDACWSLHEKYHLNLNLLIFCCWLAETQYDRLTPENIKFILARMTPFYEKVVRPLICLHQTVRRHDKLRQYAEFDKSLFDVLREADQVERSLILDVMPYISKPVTLETSHVNYALGNIFSYLNALGISLHKVDLEKVYRLVHQYFQ